MSCTQYGPWVSRYVDEDIEGEELEAFLEHLSGCTECQAEVEDLDRLRGWLQAADAMQGIPATRGEWGLADLLQMREPSEEMDLVEDPFPTVDPDRYEHRKARPWSAERIKRYLLPFSLSPRYLLRFALPLLVAAAAATWFYTQRTSNWIDVHELQPLQATTIAFPQEEAHDVDLYVIEHTTRQPWGNYGDELPMVELASGSSR